MSTAPISPHNIVELSIALHYHDHAITFGMSLKYLCSRYSRMYHYDSLQVSWQHIDKRKEEIQSKFII